MAERDATFDRSTICQHFQSGSGWCLFSAAYGNGEKELPPGAEVRKKDGQPICKFRLNDSGKLDAAAVKAQKANCLGGYVARGSSTQSRMPSGKGTRY